MLKVASWLIASAAVAAVLAGAIGRAARTAEPDASGRGLLAEVVVSAEMPRFVTDTVYVRAVRDLAAASVAAPVN